MSSSSASASGFEWVVHGRFSSYKTLIVSWVLEECSQTPVLMHCSSVLGPTQVRYADGHLNPVPFEAASHVQDCASLFPGRYPAPALQISKDAAPLLETNAIVRFVVRAKGYYDKLAAPDSNDELDKAVEAASREAWMDFALCQAPTEDTGVMGAALKALIDHAVRLPPEERSNAEFSKADLAFAEALAPVEAHLSRADGVHLGGNAFGIADLALGVQVARWLWCRDTRAATGFATFDEASFREKLVADREAAVAAAKEAHAAAVEAASAAGKDAPEPPTELTAEEAEAADAAAVVDATRGPREKLPATCAWVARLLERPAFASAVWAREAAHHSRPTQFFGWR